MWAYNSQLCPGGNELGATLPGASDLPGPEEPMASDRHGLQKPLPQGPANPVMQFTPRAAWSEAWARLQFRSVPTQLLEKRAKRTPMFTRPEIWFRKEDRTWGLAEAKRRTCLQSAAAVTCVVSTEGLHQGQRAGWWIWLS